MNLIEVLKTSKKARRKNWADGAYTYLSYNDAILTKLAPIDSTKTEYLKPTDFFADDWEPVKELKKLEMTYAQFEYGPLNVKIPSIAKVTIEWEE